MGVSGASHDDQIRLASLRQDLELGSDLTATAGEVAPDVRLEELLGDKAGEELVALGVGDERDGREEPTDGGRPGQVGDIAGMNTSLLAHGEANRHGERSVTGVGAVDADHDAADAHAPTFA